MTGDDLPRTLVGHLPGKPGARVRVCGWAHRVSTSPQRAEVVLRDHTGLARLVGNGEDPLAAAAATLVPESAVEAVGVVGDADGGDPVVTVEAFQVVGASAGPLPIEEASALNERLDWRHLDVRRPRNRLIFQVQTTALRAMRAHWHEEGFVELQTPKLRPIPNKSAAQLFAVDYFGRRAYLAQSPQWYKQMAMAAGLDRIFEVGPVFRPQAEPTSRHDTEFTSVDVEISWIRSHEDLMAFEEQTLVRVIAEVEAEHGHDVERWFGRRLVVPSTPFPRVGLAEAKRIAEATGWSRHAPDGDLDPEGERRLAAHVTREHGHEFVWVTDYPEPTRPFYHMRRGDGSVETRSFDLLWNGLEITSGAQREHRYERLSAQAAARGIRLDLIRQYLDFFKYGCPPHGGFGLGLSRLLMSMLGIADVREATYLFRGPDRLTP